MFRNLEGDEHHDFELENVDSNLVLPWSGFISGSRQAAQLRSWKQQIFDILMLIISEAGRGPGHVSAVLTASRVLQL